MSCWRGQHTYLCFLRLQERGGLGVRVRVGQQQKLLGQGSWWKGGDDPRESSVGFLLPLP